MIDLWDTATGARVPVTKPIRPGQLGSMAWSQDGRRLRHRLGAGLAAQRARDIVSGAPLTVDRDNDKGPVVALREIADVTIKIGRPDFATEAMGINEGDTYLALRPAREWTRFHSKGELIDALDKELSKIPGLNYDFTQPMAMRVDETVSGSICRTPSPARSTAPLPSATITDPPPP